MTDPELRDLIRRVKAFGEKLAIQNHGLPQESGDILTLVKWVEDVRHSWGLKIFLDEIIED